MKRYALIVLFCLTALFLSSCEKKAPAGTWSFVDAQRPDNTFFELNFITPDYGFVTGWDSKGPEKTEGWEVLVTSDGGKTWGPIPNQAENKIKIVRFVTNNIGWALNLENDILYTTDGGQTWTVQRKSGKTNIKYKYNNPNAPTELPDPLARFKFLNEKIGWAWGGGKKDSSYEMDGIFLRTEDGGQNWQKVDYPFGDELKALYFIDASNGWASDRKAGLFRTTDGGKSWLKLPDDLARPPINGIFFTTRLKGYIVGPEGYVGRTEDGGKTWEKRRIKAREFLNDIFFINEYTGWVVGDGGAIYYTSDGFTTWWKQDGQTDASIMHVQFFNDKEGWAAGNGGILLRYGSEQ